MKTFEIQEKQYRFVNKNQEIFKLPPFKIDCEDIYYRTEGNVYYVDFPRKMKITHYEKLIKKLNDFEGELGLINFQISINKF